MSDPVIRTFKFSTVIRLHNGISQDYRDVPTVIKHALSALEGTILNITQDTPYRLHSDSNDSEWNIATNDRLCVGGRYLGVDLISPFFCPDEVIVSTISVLAALARLYPTFANLHILLPDKGDLQPTKKIVKCAVYFCGVLKALIRPSWRDILWCDIAPLHAEAFRIIDGTSTMDDLMNLVALYGVCSRRSDNNIDGQQAAILEFHLPSLGLSQRDSVTFWTKFTVTFMIAAIDLQGPDFTAMSGIPYPEPTLEDFCTFIYPGWVGDTTLLDSFITSLRT